MSEIEWQAHGHSNTAHIIDTTRSTRLSKRSGPRSVCGRYPGRRYEPWWSLAVEEMVGKPLPHGIERCPECAEVEYRLWVKPHRHSKSADSETGEQR